MSEFIWRPEEHAWTRESHVARFLVANGFSSIAELREESARRSDWFWDAALRDLGVEWESGYTRVSDRSAGIASTRWFLGGRTNVTHNCIHRHVRDGHGGDVALLCETDSGRADEARTITFAELDGAVRSCAAALQRAGVARGDSVGLYAPMRAETVVVLFATMRLGARFVPIFCGYGVEALRERLASCQAKMLFACGRLSRRGKVTETAAIVRAAVGGAPSVAGVVWIDTGDWEAFLNEGVGAASRRDPPPVESGRGVKPLLPCHPMEGEWSGQNATGASRPQDTASTEAEEPCLILYTSGTTGRPKGTVHTHAGCLAQMGKELRYAFDARPGEPFFWVTDIGWMMGPWELIGCLLHRTPVVLLDGAPNFPTSDRLWQICERLGVVTLGVSPTVIRQLMRATDGRGPGAYDLSRLRLLGSTGEVWDEPSYRWYFDKVGGGRCPVINISGGTEIVGCHLSPTPLDALKPCSLGGPGLGMDVDVFTDAGRPAPRGVMGHLVCKQPAPSMTKGFLNDDARYRETYFSRFPGVWDHGDWAMIDEDGQWFLFGRTDDTLKIAGRRVGPAEVEGALASHPAVSEAAAIGVPDEIKGTALVCFVVPKSGGTVLEAELIEQVARQLGRPLAPRQVFVVPALPKTRSGKMVRGAIARVFLGQPAGDVTSVENPQAFEAIAKMGQPRAGSAIASPRMVVAGGGMSTPATATEGEAGTGLSEPGYNRPQARGSATGGARRPRRAGLGSVAEKRDEGVASPEYHQATRDEGVASPRDKEFESEEPEGGARRPRRAGLGSAAEERDEGVASPEYHQATRDEGVASPEDSHPTETYGR